MEARGEVVAEGGEAVGRHPVIGVGDRGGEISGSQSGRGVDAGLERVAPAAAQRLRQRPIGAAAGEREAHDRIARRVKVDPGGDAGVARGEIVAADHRHIAARLVVAAEGAGPRGPALLEDRRLHPPSPACGGGKGGATLA
jgi:hypothetical protein